MSDSPAYQVLARKYRPQTFADLIGQETMVRTLRNAFGANRIAHAFVMTGVRGVGKTTTARIIAKGLNCTGPAGAGGPTIEPCGDCGPCRAIAEGRHVDVLEYDAASNTQVDKMRDILASIPYRPTEARYKIIIFDEVHMLSTGSFNALLKTLEEPPAHVKFIFATTEIRKVPVTILSRCQRYDLRRIEPEVMMAHLRGILAAEGATVADDALALITRAAEGSVRDALSLLDQAIAHGAGETTADQVRAMLGLADRGRVLDLFDLVMQGNAAGALAELSSQYAGGADPMAVLRDLAEITHWISVVKITPDAADDRAQPDVADAAQGAGRGGPGPQCHDGRRNGDHPADACGRPARSGNPDPPPAIAAATGCRRRTGRPAPAPDRAGRVRCRAGWRPGVCHPAGGCHRRGACTRRCRASGDIRSGRGADP